MVRITHSVFFFCVTKYALYALLTLCVQSLAAFGLAELLYQVQILRPYMALHHLLPLFIRSAFFTARTAAAFGGVAAGASKISSMASDARARQELGAIEDYADGKMQERMADFTARYGEDALDDAVDNIVTQTEDTLVQAADKAQYSVRDTSDTSARVQSAANKSTDAKSIYPTLETAGREAYGRLSAQERTDSASVQEFVKLYRAGLESNGATWESVKGALTVEKLKNPEAIYQAGQRDGGALTTAAEEDNAFVRAATEALGLNVQTEELPEGINGYIQGDTLHLSRTARATETVAHEITHELQKKAPREYEAFQQYVAEGLMDLTESIRAKREQYAAHGITLSEAEAMDEIVAEHAQKLVRDSKAIREYVKTNGVSRGRQMWERIKTALRWMIDKLTGRAKSEAQRELNRAERLWTKAFDRAAKNTEKAQKKTADVGGGNARYWINPAFENQIDEWAKNQSNRSFLLGGTSKILKEIGVKGQKIRFRSGKLRKILASHPEMTLETIKQIPSLLESPAKPGRLVIYGELYDSHGSPVAAVLELQPKNRRSGEIEEFAILASAYGKDSNLARQILRSKIIYLSKNKKRTNHWLQGLRLQLPSHDTNVGSIGRITYEEAGVKVEGVRGSDVFEEVSGENPRYSVENQEDKIARLERELAAAKAELKRTPTEDVSLEVRDDRKSDTGETVTRTTRPFAVKDHKAIGRMAAELRRDYQSTYNKDDLTDDIQALYDIMQLNPETRESAEVRELAIDIAESILYGSQVLNDEMARNYKDLRQDLRKTAVTVSEEDREDFADGWASFRREARGLVSFKSDGMPVDTKYAELTERYPELFPEDITHPADQARQMVDVARELKPFYENLYENDTEEVSHAIADDILERFEETPNYQTYADKMNARLEREKAKGAERLERQKERAAEKLEQEQTRSAEKAAAAMERLEKRKNREIDRLQERIERQKQRREELRRQREKTAAKHKAIELVNKLATTYAKPSKEKYVPELYRKAVGEALW